MELSSYSETVLRDIYKRTKESLKRDPKIDPIYLPVDRPGFVEMFLRSEVAIDDWGDFLAPVIAEAIKAEYSHLYLIAYKARDLDVRLWYFGRTPFGQSDRRRVKGILRRIIAVRHLLRVTRIDDHLTLYLFPTDFRKLLPKERGVPLGPEHCNTGATWMGKSTIAIWREEEMEKVLIHELLHNYGADDGIGERGGVVLHEAYNEWLTTLLYLAFRSAERGERFESYKKKLVAQTEFSLEQSAKILYHYESEQYLPNRPAPPFDQRTHRVEVPFDQRTHRVEVPFDQRTHVYEYYILKSALLYHMDIVLRHIDPATLSLASPGGFMQVVVDTIDQGFVDRLNRILSQNLRFDRSLKMVL